MRVYTKIVLDIATSEMLESVTEDYTGPVALAKGPDVKFGNPAYSISSDIVNKDLRGDLVPAIKQDIVNDPFQNQASRQYQTTVNSLRGSYGARGLANSGIAIAGEQQALNDIQLNAAAQRAGQLTGLLATASSSPSFPSGTAKPGAGFMGLK